MLARTGSLSSTRRIVSEPRSVEGEGGGVDVQIEDARPEHLLAAEREEVSGEAGRLLAGLADLPQVRPLRISGRQLVHRQIRVGEDDRQQVIEVVRDTARERPDGLCLCSNGAWDCANESPCP
jgi:hypothetical protein